MSKRQIRLVLAGGKLVVQVPASFFPRLGAFFNPERDSYWESVAHLDSNVYSIEQDIVQKIGELEGLLQKYNIERNANAQLYEEIEEWGHFGKGPVRTVDAKTYAKLTKDVAKPSYDWRKFLNPTVIQKHNLNNQQHNKGHGKGGHGNSNLNRGHSASEGSSQGGSVKAYVVGTGNEVPREVREALGGYYSSIEAAQPSKPEKENHGNLKHRNRGKNESREAFEARRAEMQQEGTW